MSKALSLLFLLPNWIAYGLSNLVRRDRKLLVFGVHTSSFSGNVKSLFLEEDYQHVKVFISRNATVIKELQNSGLQAHNKYSLKGMYYSLRAGTYIYSGFPSDINFWLSGGAKYVNVWHGTPIKKIERDVSQGRYSIRNRYPLLYKLVAPYFLTKPNALLTSSPYEEQCFSSAFAIESDSFVRAFPPRLKLLLQQRVQKENNLTILYAPTWRDDHSYNVDDYIDWKSFNTFLKENNLLFFIKRHPSDKTLGKSMNSSQITCIESSIDVYEKLDAVDILVTDYSSMVFESLYLGKPVVLFCPDIKLYQTNSRDMYIDPTTQLPAISSFSQNELQNGILKAREQSSREPHRYIEFAPYPIHKNLMTQLTKVAHSSSA